MRKTIYILMLALVLSGCGQSGTNPGNNESIIQDDSSADIGADNNAPVNAARLDSIERVNNESVIASGDNITKAFISFEDGDSIICLTANIKNDHRFFGYAEPDVKSERLILFSVFTNDVENNPFGCKLGAYYDTGGMDELTLKYISTNGNFVKAEAVDVDDNSTTVYFEKKWIGFE
jgi:hypothetical protein